MAKNRIRDMQTSCLELFGIVGTFRHCSRQLVRTLTVGRYYVRFLKSLYTEMPINLV